MQEIILISFWCLVGVMSITAVSDCRTKNEKINNLIIKELTND